MYKEDWEKAALMTFNILNLVHRPLWESYDKSEKKQVCEDFYYKVYHNGTNKSNLLTSSEAMLGKSTLDHWLTPRLVCRWIMDDNQEILDDLEEFEKLFRLCQSVIRITSQQNRDVMFKTDADGIPTLEQTLEDKYSKFTFWSDEEECYIQDKGFPLAHLIPEGFKEWEKRHTIY
jgi:hypothetical protein